MAFRSGYGIVIWLIICVLYTDCTTIAATREAVVQKALVEADICVESSDWDGALEVYSTALTYAPDDHRLLYNSALMHLALDDVVSAIDMLVAVVELKSLNVKYLGALGSVFFFAGDTGKACDAWERLLVLDPFDQVVRLKLAQQYVAASEWDKVWLHAMALYKQRVFTVEIFTMLSQAEISLDTGDGQSWKRLAQSVSTPAPASENHSPIDDPDA